MKREVMPARNWLLERFAILAAAGSLILAACVDAPLSGIGTSYNCQAVISCDGDAKLLHSKQNCADDTADAIDNFVLGSEGYLAGKCEVALFVTDPMCVDTGDWCFEP